MQKELKSWGHPGEARNAMIVKNHGELLRINTIDHCAHERIQRDPITILVKIESNSPSIHSIAKKIKRACGNAPCMLRGYSA